jgi:tRNA(Ile)-lysidine synthase
MPKLACKIPLKVALACSGGRDSMSALSFLLRGRRQVSLLHYNHGTPGSDEAEDFVSEAAKKEGLELLVGRPNKELESTELAWRDARYDFFAGSDLPIVMAHHLNDAAEWWIFSSLRGRPNLMPITRLHEGVEILRPFMHFSRDQLLKQNVFGGFDDPSNSNLAYNRNRIRKNIIPEALKVNPGLLKTVSNMYMRNHD